MKVGVGVLVAAIALASPATAAAPSLQQKVRTLQRQVASLQRQVRTVRADVQRQEDLTVCFYALGRDTDDGQFQTLGLIVEAITGNPPPPAPQRFDDRGACERVGIDRP